MARKTTARKGAQSKKGNPKESDLFVELDKDGCITLDLYDRGKKGINAKVTLCDAFVIYAKVVDGKLSVDPNECNNCSRCKGKCPFKVTEEYMSGYRVYIGGRWGKKIAHGLPLTRIIRLLKAILK